MNTTVTHCRRLQDHGEPLQAGPRENSLVNGGLEGAPPTTFDGDRSQTDHFITQFGLFRIINNTHPVITNPMRRVTLALTYIRGPNVNAWVSQQFNVLSAKVFDDVNHTQAHTDTDETLWDDFITEFKRAYGETPWEVLVKLESLQMTGDDIETYIATFEYLLRRTKRKREDISTVYSFRDGLGIDFVASILKQQSLPGTLDEWQSAARKEIKTRFSMNFYSRRHEKDSDTAMQTGVGRLSRLSEEEKERHRKEGRCFECSERGHRIRDCPKKLEWENDGS